MIREADDIAPYNVDFTKKYKGRCPLVITPTSTEQVAAVLKYCN